MKRERGSPGVVFAPDRDCLHVAGAPQEGSSAGSVPKRGRKENRIEIETFLVLRSSTEEKGERRGRGEGLSLKRNLLDVEKKRFRNGSDRLYTA